MFITFILVWLNCLKILSTVTHNNNQIINSCPSSLPYLVCIAHSKCAFIEKAENERPIWHNLIPSFVENLLHSDGDRACVKRGPEDKVFQGSKYNYDKALLSLWIPNTDLGAGYSINGEISMTRFELGLWLAFGLLLMMH